jgi:hypothetical protein
MKALAIIMVADSQDFGNAQHMFVTASDGRWRNARCANDVHGLIEQLSQEGWELVSCDPRYSARWVRIATFRRRAP